MNSKKSILIIVLIIAVAILAIYLLSKTKETPVQPVQPVADEGKFAPKLNSTLETSVTVINPNEKAPQ
jgi:hypothetical protein